MMRPASDRTARTAAPGNDTDTTLELGLHCGLPRPARRGVSLVAALALLLQPTLASLAQAQQIVDPRAPIQFRPGVGVSANGTPLVNITTPSFGGVSHNKFQRYDIDTRGVILNNSGYGGTSVIGGAVAANPNLASSRPASVIVNEVIGTGTSTLNGPTEVFGGRADVVVANPNGVGCVGCTFINAGRVTLTTGVPNPDYRAGTVSYAVTGGTVSVAGAGLKGGHGETLGRIDLIARQLRLDGPVVARESVRLRAGAMTYDAASDLATPLPGAGPVTGPAIASGADGTIRAGTISVLSRDADLGISLDGALTALTSGIEIRSDGDLRLASSSSAGDLRIEADGAVFVAGRHEAVGRITIQGRAAEFALASTLTANDAIVVETLQDLAARGTLVSGQDISLTAAGTLVASGTVSALGRVAIEGRSVAGSDLRVGGHAIAVAGLTEVRLGGAGFKATGDVAVSGNDVTLERGTAFEAGGRLAVDARDGLTLGTVLDNANLDLTIRNRLTVAADGGMVQDALLLALRGDLDNDGTLYGRTSTILSAAALTNGASGTIYGPEVAITLSGALTNLGKILSDRTLALTVAGLVRNDGALATDGTLILRAQGYAAGSRAAALTGRIADLLVTGAFENAGSVLGREGLTVQAASLRNDGTVTGGGALTRLTLAGDVDNTGTFWGAGSLTLTAGGTIRTPGDVYAKAGDLTLTAAGAIVSGGDLVAAGRVTVHGASFDGDRASRISGDAVALTVEGGFADLGQVVAASRIDLDVGAITLGTTASASAPVIHLVAAGDMTNAGDVAALARLLVMVQGDLTNTGALLAASGSAAAPASGDIAVGGSLSNAGRIGADDSLVLRTGAAFTAAATSLITARTIALTVGGSLDNAGRLLAQGGDLTLSADGIVASTGDIIADGRLALLATGYEAASDHARMGGYDVVVRLGQGRLLNLGEIVAAASLDVKAGALDNGAAGRIAGTGVTLALSDAAANNGAIEATADLSLSAASLTNAGTVVANDAGNLILGGALTNSGEIVARTLTASTGGDLGNTGLIGASDTLTLAVTGRVDNAGSLLAQNGDFSLSASGIVGDTGDIIAGGRLALTAAGYEAASDQARMGGHVVVVRLDQGRLFNLGQVVAVAGLDLRAGNLANGANGRIAGADTTLAVSGTAANAGRIEATAALSVSAAGFSNAGIVVAGGSGPLTLTLAGRIDNAGSLLAQGGDLTLSAGGIVASTGDIIAGGRLALLATGYEAASDHARMGGHDVVVRLGQGHLLNLGQIVAAASLDIKAGALDNGEVGRIAGAGITLALSGAAANAGAIEATADLSLSAASLTNAGTVVTNDAGNLILGGALTNSGEIVARTLTASSGGDLGNTGLIGGSDALTLAVAGRVHNTGSLRAQGGDLALSAGGIVASTGDIIAGGRLALTAAGYEAASDQARMGGHVVVVRLGQGRLFNLGQVVAVAGLDVQAGSLDNGTTARIAGADVSLALSGAADNRGKIEATGSLALTASTLANAGSLTTRGDLVLSFAGIVTSTGDLIAGGDLALTAAGYEATSDQARLGGHDVVLRLGQGRLLNLGQIVAASGLDVQAGALDNGADARIAGAGVTLTLSGAAANAGAIEATADLFLSATSLTNAGTVVANDAGIVTLGGALTNGGKLVAQILTTSIGGDLGNTGLIGASDTLTLAVAGRVDNAASLLAQNGDLTLTAGGIVATTGDIIAGGRLALTAAGYEAGSDQAQTGAAR